MVVGMVAQWEAGGKKEVEVGGEGSSSIGA
jgi:hypothetical protein